MIVRIMGEGQYFLEEGALRRLNELDEQAMAALGREEETELDGYLDEMAELVRAEGKPLTHAELKPSDVVIPPSDLTLEETRKLFSEEGLIPDLPA